MPSPTSSTSALANLGLELVRRALEAEDPPVTLIGLSVSNLTTDRHIQLEFPLDSGHELRVGSERDLKRRALDERVDQIRERFGRETLRLGTSGRGQDDDFRRLAEKS